MTSSSAPSGAYCYIIEVKEDSGVFSMVGADNPELVFISSVAFGSGAVVSVPITGDKYGIYDTASGLAEDDANVFVNGAQFVYGWYMPHQIQLLFVAGETTTNGDRLNMNDPITYYSTNGNASFNSYDLLVNSC